RTYTVARRVVPEARGRWGPKGSPWGGPWGGPLGCPHGLPLGPVSEHVAQCESAIQARLVRRRNDVAVSAPPILRLRQTGVIRPHEQEAVRGAPRQVVAAGEGVELPVARHLPLESHLGAEQIV